MAKRPAKYVEPEDDDLDDYADEDEALARHVIINKYKEDISEIFSQAYSDVDDKIVSLLEELEDK
jgi:hypothetical protein